MIDGTVPRRLLFLKSRNRLDRPYTAVEDEAELEAGRFRVRSIRKLARRGPRAEVLCTGHGGWTFACRAAMAAYLGGWLSFRAGPACRSW